MLETRHRPHREKYRNPGPQRAQRQTKQPNRDLVVLIPEMIEQRRHPRIRRIVVRPIGCVGAKARLRRQRVKCERRKPEAGDGGKQSKSGPAPPPVGYGLA